MALSIHLTEDTIWTTASGDVVYTEGYADLSSALEAAAGHDRPPDGGWRILFDIRESTEVRSSNELRALAALVARYRACLSGRCALVCSDELHYGLSRIFTVYLDGTGIASKIFDDLEPAQAWLNS